MLSIDDVLEEIAAAGIQVQETGKLPRGWWGAYCDTTRTILIPAKLPLYARPATLLHELEHARRGDHGHQSPRVEAQINRQVAQRLVCPWDYRLAEQAHGGHPGGIAHELEQPLWVVEAYRSLAASAGRFPILTFSP